MAIIKNYLKTKPICKITFEVPSEAESISVVGDFNDWNVSAHQLKKLKSGKFKGNINLEKGKSYEFKYVADGTNYFNDDQADSFHFNDYAGSENGVLSL
jgi:1,4-alpha-glucan branching enzyme